MADALSSPERSPHSVKVKYSGKNKPARRRKMGTDDQSRAEPEDGGNTAVDVSKSYGDDRQTSKGRVPKKVDEILPGPSPKRAPKSLDESGPSIKPSSKVGKVVHSRTSSIASASTAAGSPSTSKTKAQSSTKPLSAAKSNQPQDSSNLGSPEEVSDGASSIAESTKIRRKRKTEADRIQFIKDDPKCQELEPNRALCSQCHEWIPLHAKRRYVMQNWVAHRKFCVPRPLSTNESGVPLSSDGDTSTENIKAEVNILYPAGADVESPLSEEEAAGKAMLENEPKIGEIQPYMVYCTACTTYVGLTISTRYCPDQWRHHLTMCDELVARQANSREKNSKTPTWSPPPAQSESFSINDLFIRESHTPPPTRKRAIVHDSDDESEYRSVRARTESYVAPKGNSLWDTLTRRLTWSSPPARSRPICSADFYIPSDSDSPPPPTRTGVTMHVSEDELEERLVCARTESHEAPKGHGLWDNLTRPIRNFVQGFKEGLNQEP